MSTPARTYLSFGCWLTNKKYHDELPLSVSIFLNAKLGNVIGLPKKDGPIGMTTLWADSTVSIFRNQIVLDSLEYNFGMM